jgi:hypothetical protein
MAELIERLEVTELALDSARTLVQLSDVLSAARSLSDVAAHVPELARLAVGADFAVVGLREPDGRHLRYLDLTGLPKRVGERWLRVPLTVVSPPTDAARDGTATYFATWEEAAAAYPHLADDLAAMGFAASVNVPLTAAGTVLGVFGLAWTQERRLSDPEREVLLALAGFTAQTVARLASTAEQRSSAETLQRSLLTRLPDLGRLELHARYVPAMEGAQVGGDWYDAVVSPGGAATVVVGDVAGPDMRAAAAMGQIRGLLRAYVWDRDEAPSATVCRLDRAMSGLAVEGIASLLVARLEVDDPDAAAGRTGPVVRWTNAGHPPPIVLHPDGRTDLLATQPQMMVGVTERAARADHVVRLPAGATLLLYTDGLIEGRSRGLDDGIRDLRAALARCRDPSTDDLLDTVLAELVGDAPDDDCVLLAVRCPA